MEKRLKDREFLAGKYSIADMACFPWVVPWKRLGQSLRKFPNLKAWFESIEARPAVKRGLAVGEDIRKRPTDLKADERAHAILFGGKKR